ncbi:MAG: hypothetical protein MUQ20_04495 [Deltaproteobacteria bacterium]|nr:hypothetical protein [Deltaproteobacteria bacterium]
MEIKESEKEIRLKPMKEKSSLVRKNGILVVSADSTGDIIDMIDKVRFERSRNFMNPQGK